MRTIIIKLTDLEACVNRLLNGKERFKRTRNLSTCLKKSRLELGYTLQDASENICSQAYLSKAEHNMINTENEIVRMLCERLNINYLELLEIDSGDTTNNLLKYVFYEDNEKILALEFENLHNNYIAANELIICFKCIINKNYVELEKRVNELNKYKDSLGNVDLFALIYVVYKYNFISMQYKKAMEYLHFMELLKDCDPICDMIVRQERFLISCKINSGNAFYLFTEIKREYSSFSFNKQFLFNIYFSETLSDEKTYEYLVDLGKNYVPDIVKEEYQYAVSLILTKLERYEDALDYIKDVTSTETRFAALYGYNLVMIAKRYDCIKKEDYPKVVKDYCDTLVLLLRKANQTSADAYHLAFLRLIQFELDLKKKGDICNFIRENFLKTLKDYTYPLYDDYIRDRYCILLGELSRYKDAYQFLVDHKNYLKK